MFGKTEKLKMCLRCFCC